MLVHIAIKNLAIVKTVSLALSQGLTAITGETGAGKSIALDALSLCLGARAESSMVRKGADKAEVIAHFDVSKVLSARTFLDKHELTQDDNPDECFIRRVISQEGRSKAFVNGIPVNLTQLKELGKFLALIHSQHAHYQFLKPDYQKNILDKYAKHDDLVTLTEQSCKQYQQALKHLKDLELKQQQREDRIQLLSYQVQELDEFSISEGEFEDLESSFKKLNNTQELQSQSEHCLYQLKHNEDINVLSVLNQSIKSLTELNDIDPALTPALEGLQGAQIQIEDACQEIELYQQSIEANPEQLQAIESRYGSALDLARKHQISPENLHHTHAELADELSKLTEQEDSLKQLKEQLSHYLASYRESASTLSQSRCKYAKQLAHEIESSIKEMNLPHANVKIDVVHSKDDLPSNTGNDEVSILLSVNPGQELDLLEKVVSGGELSRIGLAIQVITSRDTHISTMVFDEVDTGISGPTASLIGKLLRKLGKHSQVVCVTHLPQVAAQAHHQLFVSKVTDGKTTETNLLKLTKDERVNEIARLLAGDELTDTAIANARDLLKSS